MKANTANGDDEMKKKGLCLQLGIEEYGEIFDLQQKLNQARRKGSIPDTVIFLQHHHCYTVGRKGGFDHILVNDDFLQARGIKVYETDRGGDITYHGPGQLVCYPILNLNQHERDVHLFARRLEETLIRTLAAFGITAGRKKEYPGVWVDNGKIAAEGIAVQNWVTMHGVALNVNPDLAYFSFIVPCGLAALGVTSMERILGYKPDFSLVLREMRRQLSEIFNLTLEDINWEEAKEMVGPCLMTPARIG